MIDGSSSFVMLCEKWVDACVYGLICVVLFYWICEGDCVEHWFLLAFASCEHWPFGTWIQATLWHKGTLNLLAGCMLGIGGSGSQCAWVGNDFVSYWVEIKCRDAHWLHWSWLAYSARSPCSLRFILISVALETVELNVHLMFTDLK